MNKIRKLSMAGDGESLYKGQIWIKIAAFLMN
jgi:hypothetical protein